MNTCPQCGGEVTTTQNRCYHCGKNLSFEKSYQKAPRQTKQTHTNDSGGFLWVLLGFCLPIVGLILFLVWIDERPKTAKASGLGALLTIVLPFALFVFTVIFIAIFMGCGMRSHG